LNNLYVLCEEGQGIGTYHATRTLTHTHISNLSKEHLYIFKSKLK
jgi:hypothetical protein